jgi:hypothetical protein
MNRIIIYGLIQYILEFNDYFDYCILSRVNSLFREIVIHGTDYNDFIEIKKKSQSKNNSKEILFAKICKKGKLRIAKWFYYYYSINKPSYINYAFVMACKNNHLELSKWLYSIGAYPICWNYYPFYKSCVRGHLEISKWLYSFGINEKEIREILIKNTIKGNLDIIKWFNSLGRISDYSELFTVSLIYERKHIIIWLIENFNLLRNHITIMV